MEARRKALEVKAEKLNNEKTDLIEMNNKLLDKVLEEKHRARECRTNWNIECNAQEHKIKEQDMEMRELKRTLNEAEEGLRIQESNDRLNPLALATVGDNKEEKDPKKVIEVEKVMVKVEEEVDVEDN
ncbi:hypothetical protein ACH5RR_003517 [Cinchona calisaya]|uniref:Uncharacterized protein n=1 Tax=Cinchona calisaya TaxID=153742 RepID=A0ABD3AVD8_9GENT